MIKAVIFGFNGVIYNSTPYIWRARNAYLENLGVKRPLKGVSKHLGRALKDQIRWMNQEYNLNLDFETFSKETRKISRNMMIKAKIKPNPGVIKLINDLKQDKIKIGIASFFPKKMLKEDLIMLGLSWNDFDVVTALEDISKYRPDPEFLLKTSYKLEAKPEDCVFISDDNEGLSIAQKIGMKTVGLVNKFQKRLHLKNADLVVNSLKELKIKRINELK